MYDLGKMVAIYLYNGKVVKDGVMFYIRGYGQQFTRDIRDFLIGYVEDKMYVYEFKVHEDSTESILVKDSEMAERLSELLLTRKGYYEYEITVDKVVKIAREDKDFREGFIGTFEMTEEYEFMRGTQLEHSEEMKVWNMIREMRES